MDKRNLLKALSIGFRFNKNPINRERIEQIFYFLLFFVCSPFYRCIPVYSSPVPTAQIAQTQKSFLDTESVKNQAFFKNSESTDHQLQPLDYKFLQTMKDSSGRPVTNNANQPYFVWTTTMAKPVVYLPQQSKKNSLQLIEKRHSENKKVVYNTCKITSIYIIWKLSNYLHKKYFYWPIIPETFQQRVRERVYDFDNVKVGNYTYQEYFTNSLRNFLFIPPEKKKADYKICKILEKSDFFLDELNFFIARPWGWVATVNSEYRHEIADYKALEDELKVLSRECSNPNLDIFARDLSTPYWDQNIIDITCRFNGDPGFFDFLFGKLVLKFWQITWKKSLYR